jgi:hypothetical protein
MPRWAAILAYLLYPASFAATVVVFDRGPNGSWGIWLVAIPVLAPIVMASYASWAFFPGLHAAISPIAAGSSAWALVLVFSLLPWIEMSQRGGFEAGSYEASKLSAEYQGREERPASLEKLKQLTQDTPLWTWMEYTAPERGVREEAFARIRTLPHRQADADNMLANGVTGFLRELPDLGLEPTPSIIAAHKMRLREIVTGIQRPDAGSVKYSWISSDVDPYLPSIQWMAERHCGCSAEVAALEAAVRKYKRSTGRAECLAALAYAQNLDKN